MDLLAMLSKNSDTEIGKKWKFGGISSLKQFQKQVPLTSYEVFKPYIDRIADHGEQNLLTTDTIVQFAPSSGTTGKMKLIPVTSATVKSLPSPATSEKILLLNSIPDDQSDKTISSLLVQSLSIGMQRHLLETCPGNYVAPLEAYNSSSVPVAIYIQLVFGVRDATVNILESTFITLLISALKDLTLKWPQLLINIEKGKFHESLSIPAEERRSLDALLGGPDPARADQLRIIFQQAKHSNFSNIIPAIWPHVKIVKCLCSGNLTSLIPVLKHYTGPDIHVLSFMYACSEAGVLGLAFRPSGETSVFRLAPHNLYEFIPLSESSKKQPETLQPSEVEVGEIYEIVITTSTGFYRYRNGDFIKVIEQGENGPLIDFHGRRKMTLQLRDHILFEVNMEEAMTVYTKTTHPIVYYTVSIDEATYSRYQVWLECEEVREDIDSFLDEALQYVDETYKYDRNHKKLDQLIVSQVKPDTFAKIMVYLKSKTIATETQLKIPRMVFHDEAGHKIRDILKKNLM